MVPDHRQGKTGEKIRQCRCLWLNMHSNDLKITSPPANDCHTQRTFVLRDIDLHLLIKAFLLIKILLMQSVHDS